MKAALIPLLLILFLPKRLEATDIKTDNICIQYVKGGYYIKYDLIGSTKNGHVIVDLTYHDETADIELRPDLGNLKGDVGTKFIKQGIGKTIYWDVSKDTQAPYREGRIILTPTLVLKGEVKNEEKYQNREKRLSKRQKRIEERLTKRGLSQEEIENKARYITVSDKLDKVKELSEILYLDIKDESERTVLFPSDISIFDYCALNVVLAAQASPTRPTSLDDLTDKVSYYGFRYSESQVIELGFEDVISFSKKGNSIVSSVAFIRTTKDIVTIKDSEYEIIWGCGIALHIIFNKDEKIQSFSSFKSASAYLTKDSGKHRFNFQTFGLVGGGIEGKISALSETIEDPKKLQESVQGLVDWKNPEITKTPMVITYKRL